MNTRPVIFALMLVACGSEPSLFQMVDVPASETSKGDAGSDVVAVVDVVSEDAGEDVPATKAFDVVDARSDIMLADRTTPADSPRPADAGDRFDAEVTALEVRVTRNGYRFPTTMSAMCVVRDGTVSYGARMCGDGHCTDFSGILPTNTPPPTFTVSRPEGGVFHGTNIVVTRSPAYGTPPRMNVRVTAEASGPTEVILLGCLVL